MTSPSFDLITSVGKAYSFAWAERAYLLRLAAVPFLLKIVFFTIGFHYAGEGNLLRLSLIMVPAWIVEGWMLSHFVRLIVFDQRWPFTPSGNLAQDLPVMESRYRGVMSGALGFALTQLLVGGWFALLLFFVPVDLTRPPDALDITPQGALGACILLGIAIYAFRFLWLYVVSAAGADMRAAAERLSHGMGVSARLIGVWLLCTVPAMIVMQVLVGIALMLAGPEQASAGLMVISILAKVVLDMLKNILCAAAVAFAFQQFFTRGRTA